MLARDGWELVNAEHRFASAQHVYWLPQRCDREAVCPGDCVKLIFRLLQGPDVEAEGPHHEWMWVTVGGVDGEAFYGVLDNEPVMPGGAALGMHVRFGPEHIVDILRVDGWQASAGEDILRCDAHGLSRMTYVCSHLAQGAAQRGFYTAEEPWPGNPRPDAWCATCEAALQRFGSWDEAGDQEPKLAILCGGCYDNCRERNRTTNGAA